MVKALTVLVMCTYLRICLMLGHGGYVCRLCKQWDANSVKRPIRYAAAWQMQRFMSDMGYEQCQYCFMHMERPNEHVNDRSSKCFQLSLPQCPGCYEPWEEGTECANCKINQEIDELQRSLLEQERKREMESEREILAVQQEIAESRQASLEDEWYEMRRDIEEANWPDIPEEDDKSDALNRKRTVRGGFRLPDDKE